MKKSIFTNLLIFCLVFITFSLKCEIPEVQSAGYSETLFSVIANSLDGYGASSASGAWTNDAHDDSVVWNDSVGLVVGWQQAAGGTAWVIMQSIIGIDISSWDPEVDPIDVYLRLYVTGKDNDTGQPMYFALYKGSPGIDHVVGSEDWDNAIDEYNSSRVSLLYDYQDVATSDYFEIHIQPDNYDYALTPDVNGYVYFYLASTYHMLDYQPNIGSDGFTRIQFEDSVAGGHPPKLIVEHIENVPEMDIVHHTNADVDTDTNGTEIADNITWQSPRLGYSNEGLECLVNGDSGANITLRLLDSSGSVLDEIEDSIRVDGIFAWYVDLTDTFNGYVRFYEAENNIFSNWGYQAKSVSPSMRDLEVYSRYTEYPQYLKEFSEYIVYKDDLMFIHWRSNVQDDELDEYSLRLWGNGDQSEILYNNTLADMADQYYQSSENNSFMSAIRYAIFTPQIEMAGFDDHDGLINDLDINYNPSHTGFIQPVIYGDTDNETLAENHSAYWYLSGSGQGISMALNKTQYKSGSEIVVTVNIGGDCQVELNQSTLTLTVLLNDEIIDTANITVHEGSNTATLTAGGDPSKDYLMRFDFNAEDISWHYIHDIPFEVYGGAGTDVGETGKSILQSIEDLLNKWGMNNDAGHIILLLIIMAILFALAYKSESMRVILPCLALGVGIVIKWVDPWLIAVLGLGVGFTIYRFLKRRQDG